MCAYEKIGVFVVHLKKFSEFLSEFFYFIAVVVVVRVCLCFFLYFILIYSYKKYGVTCWAGITRSESGTALNMIGWRSLEVLKFKIDATLPHR